jgi:hypothetical protein
MIRFELKTMAAIFVAAGLSVATGANAANTVNCSAPKPDGKETGAALSQKLMKCGSVLKPSTAGDPEIVLPAPAIDDPLAIHPKDVPQDKNDRNTDS